MSRGQTIELWLLGARIDLGMEVGGIETGIISLGMVVHGKMFMSFALGKIHHRTLCRLV